MGGKLPEINEKSSIRMNKCVRVIKITLVLVVSLLFVCCKSKKNEEQQEGLSMQNVPTFCADSAYSYIAAQCAFGPRVMNSAAHDSCAKYIMDKFASYGLDVISQDGVTTLYDGTKVNLKNIIARYGGDDVDYRIIICSHWDSRPWADNDADEANHHSPIDGANDGASGVGVMMEVARLIQNDTLNVGIDFICFDAEDCGTPQWADDGNNDADTWCLGSQYWADNVKSVVSDINKYKYGILLDMVGGNECSFLKEAFSMMYANSVVDKIWSTAKRLGYDNYFVDQTGGGITDDHIQVNKVGIPCADIIASDVQGRLCFPMTWHTKNDNIQNINVNTLKAVGQTLMAVIYDSASANGK